MGTTQLNPEQRQNIEEHNQERDLVADDAVTDIRHAAVMARSQALTVDALGKGFVALQEIRQARAIRIMDSLPSNPNVIPK